MNNLSHNDLFILGSLSQCPMDIWELSARLEIGDNFPWTNLNRDKVHHSLHYLRQDKLIEWELDPINKKRSYKITDKGRQSLVDNLKKTDIIYSPSIFPFDLVVNALGALLPEERHDLHDKRKEIVISLLANLEKIKKQVPEQSETFRAIVKHHEVTLLAELRWLDDLQTETGSWIIESEDRLDEED